MTSYYDYYAPKDEIISSGLVAEGDEFTLNGKEIRIFSGAFHYFRVHPQYWRDTFKKLRAAGLNAIETYMPWNLHNPETDVFDFGNGSRDMSLFLNVRTFIQMAQEEDLFVILRPGPYICSEWDFGGLPSWLLADYTMSVRTSNKNYMSAVEKYLLAVAEQVKDLTFTKGGPILAIQIENEYGSFGYSDHPRDKQYLKLIEEILTNAGLNDVLFFTSDSVLYELDWGAFPGVLMTANLQTKPDEHLGKLKELQPNRPMMVMEFWTGWFDHWDDEFHNKVDPNELNATLDAILKKKSSINFYMFIGGTNFGFMAGANDRKFLPEAKDKTYHSDTTSYDYDAPLTEAGDYGPKYSLSKETIQKYNPLRSIVTHPEPPPERVKRAYGSFKVQESLSFQKLLDQVPVKGTLNDGPIPMEEFSFLNNGNGQSYGYAVYTTTVDLPTGDSTLLIRGHVRDMAQVLVNGSVVTKKYSKPISTDEFGIWDGLDKKLTFTSSQGNAELSIMVENLGRINYGEPHIFKQKKGLWEGPVVINGEEINHWIVVPLELTSTFIKSLTGWEDFNNAYGTPAAYRLTLDIKNTPKDTFLDMRNWNKGVVFVNGFNLGRYWSIGPCQTLYLPAPLLLCGTNTFVIFEQYEPGTELLFTDAPIFKSKLDIPAI